MFGSAMIPTFLSKLPILQCRVQGPCIAKGTQAGDGCLGAGITPPMRRLPAVNQEHAVHGIPSAGRSKPDRSHLLFWFSKPGFSEYSPLQSLAVNCFQ